MIFELMGLTRLVFLSFCLLQLASSFHWQTQVYRDSKRSIVDLHLSLQNSLTSTGADDEDKANLNRWEQMYFEAEQEEKGGLFDEKDMMRSAIRVVSFDLDNTLWKTKFCIGSANDALAAYLDKYNVKQPKRVEKIMDQLFQANKKAYAPRTENATTPVLLTQLRKDALKEVLTTANNYTQEEATIFANEAFECWTAARHEAIPRNFATDVLGCLERISAMRTAEGKRVLIGAITDGNSDPRNVDGLMDYFDFCVNAESVGVSKPDRRVYLDAVKYVVSHPDFEDLGRTATDKEGDLEDAVGSWWVHCGDDMLRDVVAAKTINMRTIWATELIRHKLPTANIAQDESNNQKLEDFVRNVSSKEVIEMPIGADNYLADAMTKEFADAVATTFGEVSEILLSWHQNALAAKNTGAIDAAMEGTKSEVPGDPGTLSWGDSDFRASAMRFRTFRLIRNDCTMDVPAPFRNREKQKMQDVMAMAQQDKSSGVFSFPAEDINLLKEGKKVLMIEVGTTGIKFSREIFASMTVDEVLILSEENPLTLNLYMQDAVDSPSFDLF